MKKISIVAAAVAIFTSGVSADETLFSDILNSLQTQTVLVGEGYADTDGVGGATFLLENDSKFLSDQIPLKHFGISGEVGKNFYSISEKNYFGTGSIEPYIGVGYLSAESTSENSGGCAPEMMFGGVCLPESEILPYGENISEKGGFGVAGLSDSIEIETAKVMIDLGYRFGDVNGLTASIGVSGKFAPEFFQNSFGLKLAYDQIVSDKENIDRFAVYATASF